MTRRAGTHMFINFTSRASANHRHTHAHKMHSLDAQIDKAELQERYKTYLIGHYLSLHVTVVSVVLAAAGLSAASLITHPINRDLELLVLWLLWVGSLEATAVAYGGPMVGAFALPAAIPSITDLLLPLLVGVSEFLQFTILISQVTMISSIGTWINQTVNSWLVIVAVFCFVAMLSVVRARHHYETGVRDKVYSHEVSQTIKRYIKYLTFDVYAAGGAASISAMGAGVRISGAIRLPAWVFPGAITGIFLVGLIGHTAVVRLWGKHLSNGQPEPKELPAANTLEPDGDPPTADNGNLVPETAPEAIMTVLKEARPGMLRISDLDRILAEKGKEINGISTYLTSLEQARQVLNPIWDYWTIV